MNTDIRIIEKVSDILKRLGLAFYIGKPRKLPKRKFCYQIRISGYKRIKRLLDVIGDLLISKRERAAIVKRLVEKRLSLKEKNGQWNKIPFDQEDDNLYQQLRELNQRGDPRDYQQSSLIIPSVGDEGIVRAA